MTGSTAARSTVLSVVELAVAFGVGHLLDQHHDVHVLHRPPLVLRPTACQTASRPPPPGPRALCYSLVTLVAKTAVTTVSRNGKVPATVPSAPRVPGKRESCGEHATRRRVSLARVTVVGTGYLGLTHAVCLADLGHEVLAIDVDANKIAMAAGVSSVLRARPGTAAAEEPGRRGGSGSPCRSPRSRRSATSTSCAWGRRRATPAGPDLSSVHAAASSLAPHLDAPCLVVGKSTVPVGTARQVLDSLRAGAGRRRGRPGLEPRVPARRASPCRTAWRRDRIVLGVTSDPHLWQRRGAAARDLLQAARGGQPAARHGPGDGRTGEGGGERVPGHQDLLHQRHGRGLRAGRRRRAGARRGPRPRRADRPPVPVARARLRRRLPAQGHPRLPRHRRRPGGGLDGPLAGHGRRDQPGPPRAGGRAGPRGGGRITGRQAGRGARRRVQAEQRRRSGTPPAWPSATG